MRIVEFGKELKEEEGKRLTVESLFRKVDKWLAEHFPEYAKACEILDYKNSYAWTKPEKLLYGDSYPEVDVRINTGGSEGIYVDYGMVYRADEFPELKEYASKEQINCRIGTFKTLEEGPEAYGKMGLIAGYLTYATELYFMINDELIKKNK